MALENYTEVRPSTVTTSTHRFVAYADGHTVTTSPATKTTHDSSVTIEGQRNSRWKEQVKRHVQAGTSFSLTQDKYDYKPFSVSEHRVITAVHDELPSSFWTDIIYSGKFHWNALSAFNEFPTSLEVQADNLAKSRFVAAARSRQTSFQAGIALGELPETIRLIKNRGKKIFRGLKDYVSLVRERGNSRTIRRIRNRYERAFARDTLIQDTWLEYQFGWRPLYNDIDDAIVAIKDSDMFSESRQKPIKGFGLAETETLNNSYNVSNSSGHGKPTPAIDLWQRNSCRVIYRGQVGAGSSAVGYAAERVGLHAQDWLPTIWELIPYSFLVDYFTNVGEIVSAGSFYRSGLNWVMKTVIKERRLYNKNFWIDANNPEGSYSNAYADWNLYHLYTPGGVSVLRKTIDRQPYSGSLIPELEFQIPGMGTRWLNMAALFSSSKSVQKAFSF